MIREWHTDKNLLKAEEDTNPAEIAKMLNDQLVERRSTNPKVVGSNPTPVKVFGLGLLTDALM